MPVKPAKVEYIKQPRFGITYFIVKKEDNTIWLYEANGATLEVNVEPTQLFTE